MLEPIDPVAPRRVTDRTPSCLLATVVVFIASPNQQPTCGGSDAPARYPDHHRQQGCGDEPIQAIHQAPVSGDEMARVLCPKPPLDRGFEEVARLSHH